MAMIVAATLTVGLDCPKCNNMVPVQGFAASTRCDSCGASVALDWKQILDLSYINALVRAVDLKPGRQESGPFHHRHLVVERTEPWCPQCKATLPAGELIAQAAKGPGTCGACGASYALRVAPPELRMIYPPARALVNEGIVGDGEGAHDAANPIVFSCMSCGAALDLERAERTVSCRFCANSNYLPDAVWLRLHPPRQLDPFVVLSELDDVEVFASEYRTASPTKVEREAKRSDLPLPRLTALARGAGNVELLVAENPACPLSLLLPLSRHADWRVRDAASKHPNATPAVTQGLVETSERIALIEHDEEDEDLLDSKERARIAGDERSTEKTLRSLAQSGGEDVRAALAANRSTPIELVLPFARDDEESVRAALARRIDLPAAAVAELARDQESSVRAIVARRRDLSADAISALMGDADEEVLLALAKNTGVPSASLRSLAKAHPGDVEEAAKENPSYGRKWWEIW